MTSLFNYRKHGGGQDLIRVRPSFWVGLNLPDFHLIPLTNPPP